VVMVEAGSAQEDIFLADIRARAPKASLVALGQPRNPDAFEEIIAAPLDLARLQQLQFLKRAGLRTPLAEAENLSYAE